MQLFLSFSIYLMTALNFSAFHPLHVSITEIDHNEEKEILEIALKIFADDFEDVLADRTGEDILIGMEGEHPKTDEFIADYLAEKISMSINGELVQVGYIGKEIIDKDGKDFAVWCYLYVPNVAEISTIELSNSVMVHWFNDQINVIHLDCNDKLKSTFFSKKRIIEEITY